MSDVFLSKAFDRFFFRKISASGFGLMRITWGLTAFLFLLAEWNDVTAYYSDAGIIPHDLTGLITRTYDRFTILDYVIDPSPVFALYLLLLFTLLCSTVGIATRFMTIISTILLFSFHERNPYTLGGGDTVLRHIGFILSIAPCITAFSLERTKEQWKQWTHTGKLLKPLQMSIWPWRLLLWQLIVLYGTSLWYKSMGDMWWNGTAVASALHHPIFARWPLWLMDYLTPFTPFVDFLVLALHIGWVSLLIPDYATRRLPEWLSHTMRRRTVLIAGVIFHGSIFIMMDAGSFSLAIFSGYLGLLLAEDFETLREWLNTKTAGSNSESRRLPLTRPNGCSSGQAAYRLPPTIVLYDGRCGFCKRSIFVLQLCDHLHRLRFVNFWDAKERKHVTNLSVDQLHRALHILVPHRRSSAARSLKLRSYSGFFAFRELASHLPSFWVLIPFLYVPGAETVGTHVYERIAKHRK